MTPLRASALRGQDVRCASNLLDSMRSPDNEAPQGELRSRVVSGGLAIATGTAVRSLVDLCATLVIARLVTPADFGLVSMVVAVTGFVELFKDMGLSTATIQHKHVSDAQLAGLFWLNIGVGAALTVFTAMLAPAISWGYHEPALARITLALSLGLFLGSLSIQHHAILRRKLEFTRIAKIETAGSIVSSLSAVLAAYMGLGIWALVVRQLSRPAATALATWWNIRWWPGWPRRAPVRELVAVGRRVVGFQFTSYLERNLDNVLVGRFAGAADLGCYTRAYELLRLPLAQIGAPVSTIALPALSRLAGEGERYRDAYLRMLRPLLLLTIPLCPFLVVCADWVVEVAFGPGWARAVPMFQWLGVAMLFKPIAQTTGWLFVSQGRTGELWRWGIVAFILALVSFVAGLPWGAVGVAASYALVDVLVRIPILFAWVGRIGPVRARDLLRAGVPTWAAAAVVGLALLGFRSAAPESMLPWQGALIGALITVAGTLVTVGLTPQGRLTFRDLGELLRRGRRA